MYTTERIVKEEFVLSYRHYKSEKEETLVVFHGFGQSNVLFESFIPSVLPYYSVIAIDLFFHGESRINDNVINHMSINRWNALFDQLLEKHHVNRLSLLSYSMGSRFVVTLLKTYSARINKIVLVAPDGFGNNFWFRVATSTYLTRLVFLYTMLHPFLIKQMVSILGFVGIFNSITKRFIERNLDSADQRKRIYASWVYFRKLTIRKDEFVGCMKKNEIQSICFCGREDQLVAKNSMKLLYEQIEGRYIELELGHHKMVQALEKRELLDFLISDR